MWCESSDVLVSNCVIAGNSAGYGGGARGGTLYNCAVSGNSATNHDYGFGGGAYSSTLLNCTLTANSAGRTGGGAYSSKLYNFIVYFNTAGSDVNYDSSSTLNYCCATPLAPGIGNISADPRLTDSAHVSPDSPCVGAGNFNYTSGTDIDGEAWADPPSIGCDEFHAGRDADDFILGFIGPKSEAEAVKEALAVFLREKLHLEMSASKTLITHARTEHAQFLGYAISIYQADTRLTPALCHGRLIRRRNLNGSVRLCLPYGAVDEWAKPYQRNGKPYPRSGHPALLGRAHHRNVPATLSGRGGVLQVCR